MVMREEVLVALRQAVRRIEGERRVPIAGVVRSGHDALDRLLPAGGMVRGTIVEWLESGAGSGANTLALLAAREACRGGGPLLVIDRKRMFYPLVVKEWGIGRKAGLQADLPDADFPSSRVPSHVLEQPRRRWRKTYPADADSRRSHVPSHALEQFLKNLVLVYPENDRDEMWALDQVLRTPHIAAVLAWPDRLAGPIFRRLQLAVETSGGLGLFVRRETAKSEPSWSDIRWRVVPRTSRAGWRLRVELLRVRGGPARGSVEIDVG